MRTTLTLDPDVVQLLKEEQYRQRASFKAVMNDAIRRGLAPPVGERSRRPYRVQPHRTTLLPGIEPQNLNQLVDELEDEAIVEKAGRRR